MTIDDLITERLRTVVREEVERAAARLQLYAPANSAPSSGPYLSVDEAAALAHVCPDTIYRWLDAGRIRGGRSGRKRLVHRDGLTRYLESGAAASVPDEESDEAFAARVLARKRR